MWDGTWEKIESDWANMSIPIGLYEFVKKGDPPVMGLTKMTEGLTLADMKRPRIKLPADVKAGRIPASMPGPLPDLAPPTHTPSAATPP